MNNKRKNESNEDSVCKKQRKHVVNSVQTKLDIIAQSESGKSLAAIGRSFNLSRSTVRSIVKSKGNIRDYVINSGNLSSKIISKRRGAAMEEMERSLKVWLDDQHQKNIPISLAIIQCKALSLFEDWKKQLGESAANAPEFKASKGWFDKFKSRTGLHNITFTGESASADTEAAEKFIKTFENIVDEGNYSSHQIFNVDETGLFWKKMPSRTYLAKEEAVAPGHKASKDRLTLLIGGNAAGDCKLKPLLVYHCENPRALKGNPKETLPVIWKWNSKAWVTSALFKDWYVNHFVPEVKNYCKQKNLAFKALLVLDNAPGHPQALRDLCPEVKVIFLPPNTSLIQPMDQSVISTFKRYYMRRIIDKAVKATDGDGRPTLKEFWKNYNVLNAVTNISLSWKEIKSSTMSGCWNKLCPYLVPNFRGFEETPESATEQIVKVMHQLDLEVTSEDVDDLMASHSEPLTNEDLLALQEANSSASTAAQNNGCPGQPTKTLTGKKINDALKNLEDFLNIIEENDPDEERSSRVRQVVEAATMCYRQLYEKKKGGVQLSLNNFFCKADKLSTPGPSDC